MKRGLCLIFCLVFTFAAFLSISLADKPSSKDDGEMVYVQVRSTKLRKKPEHFSQAVSGDVKYGTALKVLEVKEGWFKVQLASASGYAHASALTPKKVVFTAAGSAVKGDVDSEDVTLAGKGFSKAVEAEYKKQNPGQTSSYADVDRMERYRVADAELLEFMRAGKLKVEG